MTRRIADGLSLLDPTMPLAIRSMPVGRLAQTARASVLHTEGHWFESSIAHHFQTRRWRFEGR